jgi:predicted nucleotidyltransferase
MSARLKGRRLRAEAAIDGITAWAQSQGDVQGLALVGSYAYGRPRMASDVDIVLVTADTDRQISGIVVELGVVTEEWLSTPLDPGTAKVLRDGCRILHDPENLFDDALRML